MFSDMDTESAKLDDIRIDGHQLILFLRHASELFQTFASSAADGSEVVHRVYQSVCHSSIVTMEDIDEEWKEIWKPEYLKTISAFYNTAGGRFIVGRRDNGEFIGVKDVKGTLKTISDSIQNVLGISPVVRSEVFDDVTCIVVNVTKGRNKIDYNGQFYKRVGNTTHLIRREELKDIIADERGIFWMDESSGMLPDSLSTEAIARFVSMGKEINRIPDEVDSSDVEAVLDRYGLICDDGTVTIAAALLFSAHPRRINRGAFLKIGEFDKNGVLRREDILDAPLILIPDLAVDALFDKYTPPIFTYEGAFRKLLNLYPRDGIRELIVNAVVHMDYRLKEPVSVYVHPDKIEIFGFGGLPDGWTVETLMGRHKSIPRNQTLADVFHDAGYVENWAQGIKRVVESCADNGNPSPDFILEREGLSVTVSSVSQDEPPSEFVPTKNQKLILECIASDPSITQKRIAESTGLSERAIRANISSLVDAGVVRREGGKRSGKWIITGS